MVGYNHYVVYWDVVWPPLPPLSLTQLHTFIASAWLPAAPCAAASAATAAALAATSSSLVEALAAAAPPRTALAAASLLSSLRRWRVEAVRAVRTASILASSDWMDL
jgi:hypothetical protein